MRGQTLLESRDPEDLPEIFAIRLRYAAMLDAGQNDHGVGRSDGRSGRLEERGQRDNGRGDRRRTESADLIGPAGTAHPYSAGFRDAVIQYRYPKALMHGAAKRA